MFQSVRSFVRSLPERLRAGFGRRAVGIAFALLVEGLLALILLTLAPSISEKIAPMAVFRLDMIRDEEPAEEEPAPQTRQAETASRPERTPPPPAEAPPVAIELPVIQLSREEMAATDVAALPPPPSAEPKPRPVMGPPVPVTPGDTPRVEGTGPNGEPLYAAAWYREPYDDELRGYLSTARGPGWGLIACRTVADFRVEDCIALDEYPQGSNIARSVLAAAWQFRVRPPQVGGRVLVGEWVRIRIDYDMHHRPKRR